VGATRFVGRAGILGGAIVLGGACAGESFELADGAASQGGSAFPPLGTTDNAGQAGAAGSGASDAGSAGSSAMPPEPVVSACGDLRPGTTNDDGEVCIPSGTFTMGNSQANVPSGYVGHGPAHEVTLGAFALDTNEVTVARYRACVSAGTCAAPLTSTDQGCTYSAASGSADRLPVTCVSWNDAVTFCEWDGRRLPTEAEWERAARGTAGNNYAWGNSVACINAVFGGLVQCPEHGGLLPKPVGSLPRGASPEGALDLTGNTWEWVADWFGPYNSTPANDPVGPDTGSTRIQRGGNWQTPPASAIAFMRRAEAPAAIGPSSFRCARPAP
jgi:formylglycine-generating enzyme required for sulfatase activity